MNLLAYVAYLNLHNKTPKTSNFTELKHKKKYVDNLMAETSKPGVYLLAKSILILNRSKQNL